MADTRFYFKTDVGYFDNPKTSEFLDERPRVLILHLRAIAYCAQHLTDGVFPIRQVVRLASAEFCGSHCESQCDVCAAVDAGLFVRIDARNAAVHDYLEHQQSSESVNARKAAGQKAAAARWSKDDDAKGNARPTANGNADRNTDEMTGDDTSKRAPRPRRSPETPIPEDWRPTKAHEEYATNNGIDLSTEAFKFRNHAVANDRRQRQWNASFSTWLAKAKDYAPPRATQDRSHLAEKWR